MFYILQPASQGLFTWYLLHSSTFWILIPNTPLYFTVKLTNVCLSAVIATAQECSPVIKLTNESIFLGSLKKRFWCRGSCTDMLPFLSWALFAHYTTYITLTYSTQTHHHWFDKVSHNISATFKFYMWCISLVAILEQDHSNVGQREGSW